MQRHKGAIPHQDEPLTTEDRFDAMGHRAGLTIAVATDGTAHTQQSVVFAGHLAQVLQATLQVLVTVRGRAGAAHGQKVMQATQELVRDLEPLPELIPLVGPADEVVGKYVEAHALDLLVIGAFKDRGAGSTADIGATAHHLMQYAPTSVLMVKRPTVHKILACIAVDEAIIVDLAIKWVKALGAELQLLHILIPERDPPLEWSVTNDMPLNEILARGIYLQKPKVIGGEAITLDDLLQQPTQLASFLRETIFKLEEAGLERSVLSIQSGKLIETIFAVAQKQAPDLIIIGRHSDPGHFLSSAAKFITSLAPHSVLVVRMGR